MDNQDKEIVLQMFYAVEWVLLILMMVFCIANSMTSNPVVLEWKWQGAMGLMITWVLLRIIYVFAKR